MPREKPVYKHAMEFVRYHLGKHCFAPHTGQDWPAWMAFVYLMEMYCHGDSAGREAAVAAMRAVLTGVQNHEDIHQTFVQVIPAVMDWSDADRIWPLLGSRWDIRPVRANRN
jgi:hypothetical protein